jgi:hypothetical protein
VFATLDLIFLPRKVPRQIFLSACFCLARRLCRFQAARIAAQICRAVVTNARTRASGSFLFQSPYSFRLPGYGDDLLREDTPAASLLAFAICYLPFVIRSIRARSGKVWIDTVPLILLLYRLSAICYLLFAQRCLPTNQKNGKPSNRFLPDFVSH